MKANTEHARNWMGREARTLRGADGLQRYNWLAREYASRHISTKTVPAWVWAVAEEVSG